ncbi:MAG: hypothetical protein AB1716_23780 [Planctomycetota bacterium]
MNPRRRPRCFVIVMPALSILTGCAQRHTAVTMPPGPEETPVLTYLEPVAPVSVAVEGRYDVPAAPLTVPFPDPGPTAEERKILGTDAPTFEFLEYPNAVPPPPSRPVGSSTGGTRADATAATGVAAPGTDRPHTGGTSIDFGGARTDVQRSRHPTGAVQARPKPTVAAGTGSGIRVQTEERDRRVADRKRSAER